MLENQSDTNTIAEHFLRDTRQGNLGFKTRLHFTNVRPSFRGTIRRTNPGK
jgi:hypothetical protein